MQPKTLGGDTDGEGTGPQQPPFPKGCLPILGIQDPEELRKRRARTRAHTHTHTAICPLTTATSPETKPSGHLQKQREVEDTQRGRGAQLIIYTLLPFGSIQMI